MNTKFKCSVFSFFILSLFVFGQKDIVTDGFLLRGKVIDKETKKVINKASVQIIGTDSSSIELLVDSTGQFHKELKFEIGYLIVVSAPNYLNAKGKAFGPHGNKEVHHLYELEKMETCAGLIPLIIYAENETINPHIPDEEDKNTLEILYNILKENPRLIVELIGYRDSDEKEELSRTRAISAVNKIRKMGISEKRITGKDGGIDHSITKVMRLSDLNSTNITHNRMLIFNIVGSID